MSLKGADPTLDLHGKLSDEVWDQVDRFIRRHQEAGRSRVRIMPGKGKGILKKELLNYLKTGGYPYEFEKLSNGNRNEGVFVVHI